MMDLRSWFRRWDTGDGQCPCSQEDQQCACHPQRPWRPCHCPCTGISCRRRRWWRYRKHLGRDVEDSTEPRVSRRRRQWPASRRGSEQGYRTLWLLFPICIGMRAQHIHCGRRSAMGDDEVSSEEFVAGKKPIGNRIGSRKWKGLTLAEEERRSRRSRELR